MGIGPWSSTAAGGQSLAKLGIVRDAIPGGGSEIQLAWLGAAAGLPLQTKFEGEVIEIIEFLGKKCNKKKFAILVQVPVIIGELGDA